MHHNAPEHYKHLVHYPHRQHTLKSIMHRSIIGSFGALSSRQYTKIYNAPEHYWIIIQFWIMIRIIMGHNNQGLNEAYSVKHIQNPGSQDALIS